MINVDNRQFYSAAEAGRMYGAKAAAIVKGQPGYDYKMGYAYCFALTRSGGVRLYASVSGNYMDASLKDIDGITIK
jgi:hypothetical protein